MTFGKPTRQTPKDRRDSERAKAKRAALRALRKARKAADASGAKLSDWEGEFLGSVEGRVEKYGRAFGDPDKGAPGASLSALQSVKLKEIAAKASGKKAPRRSFGRARYPSDRQ
ncbi:MAG: hypothetical protein ABSD74_12620 [Rhizomicrobium sp.]|jgi:hypothetical protein